MNNQGKDKLKSILIAPSDPFLGNEFFNADNKILNRDNTLEPGIELKNVLKSKGYDLNTMDIGNIDEAEWLIFFDSHKSKDYFKYCLSKKLNYKMILMLWEPPVTSGVALDRQYHFLFRYVLTWNDDLVDNKKYYKFYIPQPLYKKSIQSVPFSQRKLVTLITGHKFSIHPKELYSERRKAINYFSKMVPQDFDFYGMGWGRDAFHFSKNPVRLAKNIIKYLMNPRLSSFKGMVEDKVETLARYKFSICYENMRDIRGYVTEKIFHCMYAGCIPVYWGASNITDYIPADCFIDKRKYSYKSLYNYLLKIDCQQYEKYQEAIKQFLKGEGFQRFSIQRFIETLCSFLVTEDNHKGAYQ